MKLLSIKRVAIDGYFPHEVWYIDMIIFLETCFYLHVRRVKYWYLSTTLLVVTMQSNRLSYCCEDLIFHTDKKVVENVLKMSM